MDEIRVHPETAAGDPFVAAPCVCNDGWVSIGQMVIDEESGEEVEEFALYLCTRCAVSCEPAQQEEANTTSA